MEQEIHYTNINESDNKIDLLDLFIPIIKHVKLFLFIIFLFIVGSITYALLATKYYESKAVITPITNPDKQANGGLANIASSIGMELPGMGIDDNSLLIMSLLSSRSLTTRVFNLYKNGILYDLYPDSWDQNSQSWKDPNAKNPHEQIIISNLLKNNIKSFKNTDGMSIDIKAEFKDPELAKNVVDALLTELNLILQEKDLTSAQRYKTFVEDQLLKNKKELINKATSLSEFYKKYDIPSQSTFMSVDLENDIKLKNTNLLTKTVNPDNKKNEYRVDKVPTNVYLDYLINKQNILKISNSILEQQYIQASMDAEKSRPGFYVVDNPEVPEMRSRPKRALIVVLSTIAGGFFSFLFCHTIVFIKKNIPEFKRKMSKAI